MADNLHEVVTGARQDRSRARTSTISGAIQSVTFVSRKAQVEPLLAILDTPLVARHLAGAAASWPRREAFPCSALPGEVDLQRIGARTRNPFQLVAFCSWCEQASASQTRSARVPRPLLPDRHVLKENAGEPRCPDLVSHLVPLPMVLLDDVQAGVGAMCTSMRFDSQMVDLGGQNLVVDYLVPQTVYHDKRPAMVATPMRFSTATTFFRRVPQAPQLQNARMTPDQARYYTIRCAASKPPSSASQSGLTYQNTTGPSKAITANMEDVHRFVFTVETTSGCACVPATRCSESDRRFPTTHSAGTWGRRSL